MSESVTQTDVDALEELEAARERLREIEDRIDDHGGEAVEDAAKAYRRANDLLESYVDRATGTGRENFRAYVELEGKFSALVDGLPDELKGRDAFEAALEAIDKRRLSESDFERAKTELEPAQRYAELIDEREAARETLQSARTNAGTRLREIEDELTANERLLELSNADLDAPIERLREPIERYNEAIREAFEQYRREASTREMFGMLERTRWYPFVEFERPPEDLAGYVQNNAAGEEPIDDLLEYANYSRSKLSHYVADADELKRKVATQQTYLEGIDAEPLTLEWPPERAETLRRRAREYRPFVARIADEETVATLRAVQTVTRNPEYDRLQTAAAAIAKLTPSERERVADGRVAEELEALREERVALEVALEEDELL